MTDDKSENLKPLSDSARLAEQLVEFSKTDKPKTTGSLPSGRLSLLKGERTQFIIMDGVEQPQYDENGELIGYCEEPEEIIEISLLDDSEPTT